MNSFHRWMVELNAGHWQRGRENSNAKFWQSDCLLEFVMTSVHKDTQEIWMFDVHKDTQEICNNYLMMTTFHSDF